GHCTIGSYSFFGVNSTIRDYLTIGEGTLVGMAAAVTKNTDAWGVYVGNPAEKRPIPSYKAY
ncbi:MAG: sugar O-acyltransferase, partial [Oxalobacteraceae bacterium]